MSVRKSTIAIVIATLVAVPAVFAQSASVFVGGERGWVDLPVQSSLTREQVNTEYLQFRSNPVAADGGRYVGGQEGYRFPDKIPNNPKPIAIKTPAEQLIFRQQYPQ